MVRNLPANARDVSSIHVSGTFFGGGNGNPLKSSMDRGAWQATVRGVTKSRT